jgi:hypothetical protein
MAGVETYHWSDKRISTYDMFDSFNPNVFVTKYNMLNVDVLSYLSDRKTVSLVLNVSGILENEARDLEETLESSGIKTIFVYYSGVKPTGFDKIKVVQIMQAADIFLPSQPAGNRQIPFAVVSDEELDTSGKVGKVYHKVLLSGEPLKDFDVNYSVIDLSAASAMYENMLLCGNNPELVCGQLFFDMTIRLKGKCAIDITDQNAKMVDDFMKDVFGETNSDSEDMKNILKTTILNKHTAINRAERFAKFVGLPEPVLNNIRNLMVSSKNNLQNPRS